MKANASPLDVVTLMVTMVEHVDLQRDYVVHKSIWHLSDAALKSVCESSSSFHLSCSLLLRLKLKLFTKKFLCLSRRYLLRLLHSLGHLLLCVHEGKHAEHMPLQLGTKLHLRYVLLTRSCVNLQDPFYDSEAYRGQGGDGTVHWYYDRVCLSLRLFFSLYHEERTFRQLDKL